MHNAQGCSVGTRCLVRLKVKQPLLMLTNPRPILFQRAACKLPSQIMSSHSYLTSNLPYSATSATVRDNTKQQQCRLRRLHHFSSESSAIPPSAVSVSEPLRASTSGSKRQQARRDPARPIELKGNLGGAHGPYGRYNQGRIKNQS
jgi:hypothetical protein